MKVYIDADGCPVVNNAVEICRSNKIEVTIVSDTSHIFNDAYAHIIIVDKGSDSADMKIVALANKDDIIITQDYGLAAMALAKGCSCISQDGMIYSSDNIDSLLLSRYTAKKIRSSGGRLKGPKKRKLEQDEQFRTAFVKLISKK